MLPLYADDSIIPVKRGKSTVMKILQRHHFSSALKRMCVVVAYDLPGSEMHYMVAVKGAPETLKTMVSEVILVYNSKYRYSRLMLFVIFLLFQLSSVPENYDSIYLSLSRRGARVLALGYRKLNGISSSQDIRELSREKLECDLTFAGFVIISCPLKPDSKAVIKEIVSSSHSVRIW